MSRWRNECGRVDRVELIAWRSELSGRLGGGSDMERVAGGWMTVARVDGWNAKNNEGGGGAECKLKKIAGVEEVEGDNW